MCRVSLRIQQTAGDDGTCNDGILLIRCTWAGKVQVFFHVFACTRLFLLTSRGFAAVCSLFVF
jgi:hypothetical protein